jgi:RNA polymerase sigma factor (sigma-70 family)
LLTQWNGYLTASVQKYAGKSSELTDLLGQVGRIALWRATLVFSSEAGHSFENFARRVIKNAMIQELRDIKGTRSKVWQQVTEVPEILSDDPDPYTRLEQRAIIDRISSWTESLPETLKKLYLLLYHVELPQSAAARLLGVSQPRVSQLHRQILTLGRRQLTNK